MHKETLLRCLLPFRTRLAIVGIRINGQTATRQEFAPNLNILRLQQLNQILHNDIHAVLMKITMIAEAEQIELQRLAFYQTLIWNVRNINRRKIRLPGHRTQAGELRTVELHEIIVAGMLVWEGLQNLRRIIAFIRRLAA